MIFRDQDKFVFYVNDYIKWDQFNQLYDLNWIKKGINNVNAVVFKLELAVITATNYRLKIASKQKQKREKMVKNWKTEAITAK